MKSAPAPFFVRLVKLEATLDEILFRKFTDEDYDDAGFPVVKTAATAGLVGAGAAGALIADKKVMGKYGAQQLIGDRLDPRIPSHYAAGWDKTFRNGGPTPGRLTQDVSRGTAYKAAGTDLLGALKNRVTSGLRAGQHAARVYAPGGIKAALVGMRKGLKVASRFDCVMPRLVELADGRPRNPDGQFVANETGGADPQSMHAAYGPGAVAAIAGTTGAAGLGAGLTAGKIKRSLARFAK